jgi:uncharacterized protein YyaL (SSP411 family)
MIAALAFAGATFGRTDWIGLAARAFAFVTGTMTRDGRLAHSWRAGRAVFPGLATDYAAMIRAALALHAATFDAAYLAQAVALAATIRAHHWDAATPGYFLSADDAEALIMRPKALADEATASATGVMGANLVRLWHLTGDETYRRDDDDILAANASAVTGNLFASFSLLNALDLRLGAVDVVIVTPPSGGADALVTAVRERWTPNTILAVHTGAVDLPSSHPAAGKAAAGGKATAYVCRGETCSLPVTEAGEVAGLIGQSA